jgi:hypothetical protein
MSKGKSNYFNIACYTLHGILVHIIVAGDIDLLQKVCYGTPQLTVTVSSTTHSKYIVVFALQRWLRERATILRYKYIADPVNVGVFC